MKKFNLLWKIFSKFLQLYPYPYYYACGGGGGAAGGGVGTGTITNCSDTGTAFQTTEYKYMGSGVSGTYNPLKFVCASSAYARGATGDGIKVAVLDTGVKLQMLVGQLILITQILDKL